MAAKRLVRKFTEVVAEVENQIKAHYNVTQKELDAWKARAQGSAHKFPHSAMVKIEDLWIDYEVQRDVIHKHVINIMKKWDARICSSGSACRIGSGTKTFLYDAQHRGLAAAILGFTEIPCSVVDTTDPNFPSYAFELLNDTGVKRLTPGDLHRNALVRYKNGSRDIKNVRAKTLQDQFDAVGIDLQDKGSRASDTLRGDNDYFFSHFKYAYKGIEIDESGKVLHDILSAIKTTFPIGEEIDQGVFIGLYEIQRLAGEYNVTLPKDWMTTLLKSIKPTFKNAGLIHSKAKTQWEHVKPGSTWTAPSAMLNFMREIHIMNGGTLDIPYHGAGAKMGIEEGNICQGLIPTVAEV
jgi:hypothetical protein